MRAQGVMAVAHPRRAQLGEGIVYLRHRDGTPFDVHQLMNIAPVKPIDLILRMDCDSVPLSIRQRRWDHWPHWRFSEAADASHRLLDLSRLCFQLVGITHMLVTASAAPAKVWTLRWHALRRRVDQFNQFGFGELLFLPRDFRRDALALDRERNEDGFAFVARDTFPTKSDIFDFEFNGAHRRT